MARIFIIDTMHYIFRSFNALPHFLTNAQGQETGALLGVFNMFQHLFATESVTHCVAALESRTPNFRCAIDTEYKANRPPTPQPLKDQIPLVIEMCQKLGIRTLGVEGYEADDVMATLARRFSGEGHEVCLVTNDKDLAQVLRHPRVSLWRTGKTQGQFECLQADQVEEAYGVKPEQIPAWLALMGDTADNIRGIKGIGNKTAAKLLAQHSLEELMADPQVGGRFGAALVAGKEQLLHNLSLTTINDEVPLPEGCGWDDMRLQPLDVELARDFFASQQMKKALNAFDCMLPPQPTAADLWM